MKGIGYSVVKGFTDNKNGVLVIECFTNTTNETNTTKCNIFNNYNPLPPYPLNVNHLRIGKH